MSKIISVILFIWQLPQNIVGLILYIFVGFPKKNDRGFYEWKKFSGISLGRFIYLNKLTSDITIKHEQGHQKQSRILGPLYLIIIGIPSFVWATLHTYTKLRNKNYYGFYTEKWADSLSGISR